MKVEIKDFCTKDKKDKLIKVKGLKNSINWEKEYFELTSEEQNNFFAFLYERFKEEAQSK